nr:protein-glutamate O-methyltransferase [Desulfovibrio ferrophilus]
MSDKDFKRFAEFIHEECGIKLPPSKKTMLEARLQKRLRALGYGDYREYCEFLFTPEGMECELCNLIDQVTTNTTDFFREPKHFEYLYSTLLPKWMARQGAQRALNIWSAGCSIGAEPYTMACVLSDFKEKYSQFRFRILATDISNEVLGKAARGIYTQEQARGVPGNTLRKYFMRSKDRSKKLVRVAPEIRRQVEFRQLNFMESFKFREPKDIIFCRNVIIYFDKPTQAGLMKKFCANLKPGGYLFIGHSESLAGQSLPLEQVAPTIYRKS